MGIRPRPIFPALVWLVAILSILSWVPAARAQSGSACSGTWDQGGAGNRTLVVECAPGFATARDRVLIYPRGGAPQPANWRDALDARDAVWVFEAAGTGRASLVIDFHPARAGAGLVADLYDDQTGDSVVAYALRDGLPVVTESRWPTVSVAAPDGWWSRGQRTNFNLEIDVDGPVAASFDAAVYLNQLRNDGRRDYRVIVRDENMDGRPDWHLVRAFPPVAGDSAVYRSSLMASAVGDDSVTGGALWPYLGRESYGIVKPYLSSPPPIQVNWSRAQITHVGEFVASRGGGHNWFVYSVRGFGPDVGSADANFENPFAFYDLARRSDGYPDLQIRNVYVMPGDLVETAGAKTVNTPYLKSALPINVVRYSWDQDHSHSWDFKVDLLGRHAIDKLVSFPGFLVRSLPYEEFPRWVLDREWDAATFIAAERDLGWTSEGIYEWSTAGVRGAYLAGENPSAIAAAVFSALPSGMRGEYKLDLNERPYLYVSEIDGRLHLHRAQAGLYALGGGRVLSYASVGGSLIDSWKLLAEGQPTAALTYLEDQMLLEAPDGLRLKTVAPQRTPALLLPPTDTAEWNQLRETVATARIGNEADDPRALFDRYLSRGFFVPGAAISHLTAVPGGFRMTLTLPPQSHTSAEPPSWITTLAPGEYAVSYARGAGYTVEPLTPARLDVTDVSTPAGIASALEVVQLRVSLANEGTMPAQGVTVTLTARLGDEPARQVGTMTLDVPSAGFAAGAVEWVFPSGGAWTIEATAGAGETASFVLPVEPVPAPTPGGLLAAQGRGPLFGLVTALVLTAAAAAAACAGAVLVNPRRDSTGGG